MVNIYHSIELKYERHVPRINRLDERCVTKHVRTYYHFSYLICCMKNTVTPCDLKVGTPMRTQRIRQAAENVSRRFIRNRIRLVYLANIYANQKFHLRNQAKSILSENVNAKLL